MKNSNYKGKSFGESQRQLFKLYQILVRLARGRDGSTNITNKWLSRAMNRKVLSISRYVKALTRQGCIETVLDGPYKDFEGGYFYIRTITPIEEPMVDVPKSVIEAKMQLVAKIRNPPIAIGIPQYHVPFATNNQDILNKVIVEKLDEIKEGQEKLQKDVDKILEHQRQERERWRKEGYKDFPLHQETLMRCDAMLDNPSSTLDDAAFWGKLRSECLPWQPDEETIRDSLIHQTDVDAKWQEMMNTEYNQ